MSTPDTHAPTRQIGGEKKSQLQRTIVVRSQKFIIIFGLFIAAWMTINVVAIVATKPFAPSPSFCSTSCSRPSQATARTIRIELRGKSENTPSNNPAFSL